MLRHAGAQATAKALRAAAPVGEAKAWATHVIGVVEPFLDAPG
jgi:hypothetical protein